MSEEWESNLPFHTWKLVSDDSDDFELTDDELYELTVITNLYEKIKTLPDSGTIWDFASGRQARLTIHEEVTA